MAAYLSPCRENSPSVFFLCFILRTVKLHPGGIPEKGLVHDPYENGMNARAESQAAMIEETNLPSRRKK